MRIRRATAFTLIELLIVIGILAILAAIMFPVLSQAREAGRRTQCQTNVRQIAVAFHQYLQDYDGVYPNMKTAYFGWPNLIYPYTKDTAVFRCPDQLQEWALPTDDGGIGLAGAVDWTNYMIDSHRISIGTGDPQERFSQRKGVSESQIEHPSLVWLNTEFVPLLPNRTHFRQSGVSSCGRQYEGTTLHSGGANYSFVDGHVKWLTPASIAVIDCQLPAVKNGPWSYF